MIQAPSIEDIQALRDSLGSAIYKTPLLRCAGLEAIMGGNTEIYGKLEFLQRTGTFKARGALAIVNSLSDEQRQLGVTAVTPSCLCSSLKLFTIASAPRALKVPVRCRNSSLP